MSHSRGRILVVEDEELLRSNIKDSLSSSGYSAMDAGSGEEALEILETNDFDLVITDIRMGEIGGVELLTHVSQNHPDTGVMVMTAFTSEAQRYEILGRGGLQYLEKPFSLDFMSQMVEGALKNRRSEGFEATICDIRLAELIQLHCMNRATGRMSARSGDEEGEIYLEDGRFTHAVTGELSGQSALVRLLSLNGGSCGFDKDATCEQRTIPDMPGEHVLLDSLRLIDEAEAKLKGQLPEESTEAPAAEPPPKPADDFLLSQHEIDRALDVLDVFSFDEEADPADPADASKSASENVEEPVVGQDLDAKMDPQIEEFLLDFAVRHEAEYVGVIGRDMNRLSWTDDSFLRDEIHFQGLLRRARDMSRAQSDADLDVMEINAADHRMIALRMNVGFLCCRVARETTARELIQDLA